MNGFDVRLTRYTFGGNVAVQVLQDGVPYGMLSVNVEGVPLSDGEFIVKQYSENQRWARIENFPMFEDTGERVDFGFIRGAPIWRVKP